MGYYTQYSVRQLRNTVSGDVLSALIAGDECASCALDPEGDTRRAEKWYNHEATLCSWSTQYPDAVFLLHAEGEDSDGIWDKYFWDGKLVRVELFSGLAGVRIEGLMK